MTNAPHRDPVLYDLEAIALCADKIFDRNPHVIEGDLAGTIVHHGLLTTQDGDTGCFGVDEDTGYTSGTLLRVGHASRFEKVRRIAACDEAFHAVDDIVIAVAHG